MKVQPFIEIDIVTSSYKYLKLRILSLSKGIFKIYKGDTQELTDLFCHEETENLMSFTIFFKST